MDLSRRGFFVTGVLTGLAAIVRASPASAFEFNENGFNHLIPTYGDEHFLDGYTGPFQFHGIPHYNIMYKISKTLNVSVTYIGPDRYAISILSTTPSTSFTLVDDKGDKIFRRKYNNKEVVPVPEWIKQKYTPSVPKIKP